MTLCGHVNASAWHATLVCNLPIDHAGPHGIRQVETLPPYVVWGTEVDEGGRIGTRGTVGEQEEARP